MNQTNQATAERAEAPALSIPRIGEFWPEQGGVNAGLMRGVNGQSDYYLIVPTDPAASFDAEWGGYGENEACSKDDFDGLANTRALVASKHEHPAAECCAALTLDGHSDFYLPAKRELQLCAANVPELFDRHDWHWSSTQRSAINAWTQYGANGNQTNGSKFSAWRVLPVRRFIPSSI